MSSYLEGTADHRTQTNVYTYVCTCVLCVWICNIGLII